LTALDALTSLLAGRLPPKVDWLSVIALANETLVSPQIYSAAERAGTLERLPADVRGYLEDVRRRNRARNRRLFAQLREAVLVLNEHGIEPTLIKGAAFWVAVGRPEDHDRILADVDVVVSPHEERDALGALQQAGFFAYGRYDAPFHVVAELGRPSDVGVLDLHRRPPGPERLAQAALALSGQVWPVSWDGARAHMPSPAVQIFLLVLHDQFQDGGYWRGGFALRHLLEIAAFSHMPGAVDWHVLRALTTSRLLRNVTDAHLRAAEVLCGASVPASVRRPWVRLQHARLRAQFGWPRLKPLLVHFSG
jgi:hypothetical protein